MAAPFLKVEDRGSKIENNRILDFQSSIFDPQSSLLC